MELWERVQKSARRTRVTLSYPRIARAGVEIADREGLDAVSMRRVAKQLEAGPMSLYRYVESRDELIELMTDHAYAGFPAAPRSGDWRADLAEAAHHIRRTTLKHPWLAGQSVPRTGLGPNLLRMMESTLALVDGYGLHIDQMLDLLLTIQAFVNGYVLNEITEHDAQHRTGANAQQAQERHIPRVRQVIASGQFPLLARVVTESEDETDPDLAFERRLHYVLNGLAWAFT